MDARLGPGREALLQGDAGAAAPIFAAGVERNPRDFEARYWLAGALLRLGDAAGAEQALNDARILHTLSTIGAHGADLPRLKTDPDYANDIATQLYGQQMVAMAGVVWGMAIAGNRLDPTTLTAYGLCLQHQGRVEEANDVYRAAARTFSNSVMHQYAAYAQLFGEDGERRYADEVRAWAATYAKAPAPAPHTNKRLEGRKLRVGYVAPKFAESQLRQFIAPILEAHDRRSVEVVLYPADAATEKGWPAWITVRPIGQLNDAHAAALIRQDRIDVLNDCWGHTGGSRLGVFAFKPAPVQVAWINFFQTTGLPQMDYVLHAASDDPPDFKGLFTEALWPVGPVFTPFRPGEGRLPPTPTPAKATGVITFASFNHPVKLSAPAIAAWAALLRAKPDSRLLLKYRYFADPVLQTVFQTQFVAHGVAPERLSFAGHSSGEDYFRSFQTVDLMLDSWPAPGSTTSLEALSNGVPVLAMVGPEPNVGGFYARTLLKAVGLADLVATSPEDFVARGLALTEDIERLDRLRARVRPGFDNSAICDEAGFTRGLEQAFREMFERWRSQVAGKREAVPAGSPA